MPKALEILGNQLKAIRAVRPSVNFLSIEASPRAYERIKAAVTELTAVEIKGSFKYQGLIVNENPLIHGNEVHIHMKEEVYI